MTQEDHYHAGHGLEGYGPEGETTFTATTLKDLNDWVRQELNGIESDLREAFTTHSHEADRLRALRPSDGSDPAGYPGSWESIADALQRAVDCNVWADGAAVLWSNLSPTRADAPLYRDRPDRWEETLRRLLIDSGTFPMRTQPDGANMLYVWACHEASCDWTHEDYPHEPGGGTGNCLACNARCYCTGAEGSTECQHCSGVQSEEFVCDNDDCEAFSHD